MVDRKRRQPKQKILSHLDFTVNNNSSQFHSRLSPEKNQRETFFWGEVAVTQATISGEAYM